MSSQQCIVAGEFIPLNEILEKTGLTGEWEKLVQKHGDPDCDEDFSEILRDSESDFGQKFMEIVPHDFEFLYINEEDVWLPDNSPLGYGKYIRLDSSDLYFIEPASGLYRLQDLGLNPRSTVIVEVG